MYLPSTSLFNFFARDSATTTSLPNGCVFATSYTMCNDQWNQGAGTGNQNLQLLSDYGSSVSWSVDWSWQYNDNVVKAYPNVISTDVKGMLISDIVTMPSTYNWYYADTSDDISADVSYDIWTGYNPTAGPGSGENSYELMIWLASLGGAGPTGYKKAVNASIAGHNWTVWGGEVQSWYTYSFVSQEGNIYDFNGDIKLFYTWLNENEGVAENLYLQAFQAGTEPFTGKGQLIVNNFGVSTTTNNY